MEYNSLVKTMQQIADIYNSIAVLQWDKEVNLPTKGARFRSQQISTLAGIAHEKFTAPALGAGLAEMQLDSLDDRARRNVSLIRESYEREKKLPTAFVIRRSQVISACYHAWLQARKGNDFSLFAGPLADMVAVKREQCEILGYEDHPYDALMHEFEPKAKTVEITKLFADVRQELVAFAQEIKAKPQVNDGFLRKHYDKDKQWNYGLDILKAIGYDFEAGRQDISPHPFTTNFSPEDVRVTTRIDEQDLANMIWSCIHEGGHALYEQGLPTDQYGLPLGQYLSLGIHESQSRLWENNVGRSQEFWLTHYPDLQATFPENLGSVSLEDFYKAINKVEPNLIRTEADELHYHFHVLIRFEIEKGLIEGSIDVKDLANIWNAKYKDYLGVDVPDDNRGVLQDVHWAHGSIGYFPTYSLGSFYAAQFFAQAENDIPGLIEQISAGNTTELLSWLRTQVHQHGKMYTADELCTRITGEPLNFNYFMEYARKKFGGIYGL
ncbi:MAG: carboxypeptidase M32 [Bacteroidota bacterium]